jgi:D-alanyl-D-alanine carboxypeptidase
VPACARVSLGRRGSLASAAAGQSRSPTAGRCDFSSKAASTIGGALAAARESLGALGLVAGVRQAHGLRVVSASGYSDVDQSQLLETDDRFSVGSATKTFTAVLILQLVEEGRLALDDPVDAYLPGLADGGRVTVRHLLSHTSGIPDYLLDPVIYANLDQAWDHDELIASQVARGLLFEPGSQFWYSNTNYIALGRIIERVTGSTYAAELERRILRPLRLGKTYLSGEGTPTDDVVAGVRIEGDHFNPVPPFVHPSLTWSVGGMVSTADDLLRWMEALFAGRLLRPSSLAAMTAKTVLNDGTESTYCLGIGVSETPLGPFYSHRGEFPPFTSLVGYVPGRRLGIVILSSTLEVPASTLADAGLPLEPTPSVYRSLMPTLADVLAR